MFRGRNLKSLQKEHILRITEMDFQRASTNKLLRTNMLYLFLVTHMAICILGVEWKKKKLQTILHTR